MNELSREELLRKLNIKNLNQLTNDKFDVFASYISKMKTESARKIFENFSEVITVSKVTIENMQLFIENDTIPSGTEMRIIYRIMERYIDIQGLLLIEKDLPLDGRQKVIDCVIEMSKFINEKKSELRKKAKILYILIASTVVLSILVLISLLGLFISKMTKSWM